MGIWTLGAVVGFALFSFYQIGVAYEQGKKDGFEEGKKTALGLYKFIVNKQKGEVEK